MLPGEEPGHDDHVSSHITPAVESILLWTIAMVTLYACFYLAYNRKSSMEKGKSVKTLHEMPGPVQVPYRLIGNLFQLPRDVNDLLTKAFHWRQKYGPCFRLTFFNIDFVVITDASLVQCILRSSDLQHLTKTEVYNFLPGINGLAFTKGERWSSMRKLTATVFSYQNVNDQIEQFNKHGDILVNTFQNKDWNRDQSTEGILSNCIVQIIIDTFLSQPGSCSYKESLEYIHAWKQFTEISAYRILRPWLAPDFLWKFDRHYQVLVNACKSYRSFADKIIDRCGSYSYPRLIQTLKQASFSYEEIQDEIVTLLFAYETGYLALFYLFYLLAVHPEHQEICRQEANSLIDLHGDYITPEGVTHMKYIERCLLESLRIFSPVFIFGRKLEAPLLLPNGYLLPSNTNCVLLPGVIHKLPEYFPSPNEFNPGRFLPEQAKNRQSGSYFPFSSGPRVCLGYKSAMISTKIIAAKILNKFEITAKEQEWRNLKFKLDLTLNPAKDLHLSFTPIS